MATKRVNITLKSTESHERYHTTKNKTNCPDRIERMKFDKTLKKHVLFKEGK